MYDKIADLQQLRIHELRDLARKMGVQAPTILKKEEIIAEIMKIMSGESVPMSSPSKKGRPARDEFDNFNLINFLLPNQSEMTEINSNTEYEIEKEKFSLMLNMPSASYTSNSGDSDQEVEGVMEIKPEGFGVIHID